MILRDPVHGLVRFEGRRERLITQLLRAREVQRLRRVRQLGLTSLVFPGAEHSRFAHALGSAHVMVRLLTRLSAVKSEFAQDAWMTEEEEDDALAAALVHDLGHGPFSHLFEEVVAPQKHHETWTGEILRSPKTEIHQALEAYSPGMSARVADLLIGKTRLRYLAQSVSGWIDVDRCDYLLRDSHMTGARYGLYDLEWLLDALTVAESPTGEMVLAVEGRKGLPPIEGFFLGRHFMYRQVYHHKATRAAECLVRGLFLRLSELIRAGDSLPFVPRALRSAILGSTVSGQDVALADYLALDDSTLHTCFAEWENADDPLLSDLASRLRHRSLPKTLPLPDDRAECLAIEEEARRVVESLGGRPDLSVWLDRTGDVPYVESSEPGDSGGLWVKIRHRPLCRLGEVSFLLGELKNKRIDTYRLVFMPQYREPIIDALQDML